MFEAEVNPERVMKADLVVGITSNDEADAISHPTTQASEGLVKYFPDKSSVIIHCGNHSTDHTRQAFLDVPTKIPKIHLSTRPGVKGKGSNLKNLFRKVVELDAKGVVVVEANLKSITPEWIKHLAEPLFKHFSFAAPLFVRHKYEGTITSGITYPLSRALYGRRIRQPNGGDFGFSGELARHYLESDMWDEAVAHLGIGIWMSTLAMNHGARICQAFVGTPKIRRSMDPVTDPGPLLKQVVGTVFSLMSRFESSWLCVKYSKPTAICGFQPGENEMPPKVEIDSEKLIQMYYEGFDEFQGVWERILPGDVYMKLLEMKGMRKALFGFPTDLWARILYDMAIAHRDAVCDRDLIMDSLVPLYFGRTFSYVKKTKRMSSRQAEETVEEDCVTFEMTKPYLVKRWMGH
jgi:hypothetical protein